MPPATRCPRAPTACCPGRGPASGWSDARHLVGRIGAAGWPPARHARLGRVGGRSRLPPGAADRPVGAQPGRPPRLRRSHPAGRRRGHRGGVRPAVDGAGRRAAGALSRRVRQVRGRRRQPGRSVGLGRQGVLGGVAAHGVRASRTSSPTPPGGDSRRPTTGAAMADRDDSQAWLPFEEFLASGVPAHGRDAGAPPRATAEASRACRRRRGCRRVLGSAHPGGGADARHPGRAARRASPAGPVGRGRGGPGLHQQRRPLLLHAQGRAGPAALHDLPRRPPVDPVRAAHRAAARGPRPPGRVRAAGRLPAVRGRHPACRFR